MADVKLTSINYDTPEQAENMAAQINASNTEGAVKAVCKGRTLEIVTLNSTTADLLGLFSRMTTGLASLLGRLTTPSKSAANA